MSDRDRTQLRHGAPANNINTSTPESLSEYSGEEVLLRRYRVMGTCGTGGFGTVLACWDTRLQRRVAIKRMPLSTPEYGIDDQVSTSTINEALSEARTASRLEHPNIVDVHDFEVEGNTAYLVMEYIDGVSLSELLERVEGGTLTHDEVAYLVQELGNALEFAHHNGVLHLDIKPSNIIFTRDGCVKLCDFGMATLASAAGYADARGGTIGYMPPEQIEGRLVDERTDIFSLAVVVLEALIGKNPFIAADAEHSLSLIEQGPKPRPSKVDPSLTGFAEKTLLACLSPEPSSRPSDIGAVSNDLVYGLGNPEDGEASLTSLLSQAEPKHSTTQLNWNADRLPFSYRYPWLWTLLIRSVTALVCGILIWNLVPYTNLSFYMPRMAITIIAAGISCLWTPFAAGSFAITFSMALFTTSKTPESVIAAGIIMASVGICLILGHTQKVTSLALLMAPVLGESAAASAVAGTCPSTFFAALSSAVAWILTHLLSAAYANGFVINQVIHSFFLNFNVPSFISFLGCVFAAYVASGVTRSGPSIMRGILGQISGCIIVVFSQFLEARMENGGIWPSPGWENTGVEVLLGVFVCLALALRGSREYDWEDGETA